MDEQKYLISIALAEQNNQRIMPIGGKTMPIGFTKQAFPQKESEKIILDLLLRLFKRSSEGKLNILEKDTGLFVAVISIDDMQKNIPIIKSNWINNGNTDELLIRLTSICSQLWSINYKKYEGMVFTSLSSENLS